MNRTFSIGIICVAVAGLSACHPSRDDARGREAVTVKTVTVSESNRGSVASYVGTVEEASAAAVSFAVAGQVQQICVDEGDKVEAGELLAVLDKTTLQHTYDAAAATLTRARDAYDRLKLLHDSNSLADMKWVEVQSSLQQAQSMERIAAKNLADTRLTAPFSGYIARKAAEVGDNMLPGATAFTLMEIATVDVKIAVPEKEISHIAPGDSAAICVGALDDRRYRGVITGKGVDAHPLSHTYQVRVRINNSDGALLPGMVCHVELFAPDTARLFVLPANAVFADTGKRHYVWIARDGVAEKRFVTTGAFAPHGIIVTAGIEGGEHLIVEGCSKISNGMKVAEE